MSATETKTPVDLSKLDAGIKRQDDGILVPINGLDNKPLGFSIRVAGPDSKRAKAASEAMTDELIASEDDGRPTARTGAVRAIRFLARVTMGWEPAVVLDGETLEYDEENAFRLYQRFDFIAQQVNRAAGKRAAFLTGSDEGSSEK